MKKFSKRNNLRKEYSGYEEASLNLRNRLLQLYGLPYSGNEYNFGIGNTNWVHEVAFSKDLQMHFGLRITIEDFRNEEKTSYDMLFDFIELYYQRALRDLDSVKRRRLSNDIKQAFLNSGSVYEFSEDGRVIIKIYEDVAQKATKADKILSKLKKAQAIYRDSVDGLITRTKLPKDVIGDIYIALEEYLKDISGKKLLDNSTLSYLQNQLSLHPTQIQLIKSLIAYRGDVWGVAHAGNSPSPDERDALWFLESVIAQIIYIDNKVKQ